MSSLKPRKRQRPDARLRLHAEQQCDELAREILKDSTFREEFVALAREVAREALEALRARH